MRVCNTLEIDLVNATIKDKVLHFIADTEHRYTGMWQAQEYIKKHFPNWQYNGADKFENILIWCQRHLDNNFVWNWETIYFKTEEDRTLFLLRWT